MVLEIYNSMPLYTYWLIWWALPSVIAFIGSRFVYKDDLQSPHKQTRKNGQLAILTLTIIWPLFALVVLFAFILDILNNKERP